MEGEYEVGSIGLIIKRLIIYFVFVFGPFLTFYFLSKGCNAPATGGGFYDFTSCYPKNSLLQNLGNLLQVVIFISLMMAFIPLIVYVMLVIATTELVLRSGKVKVATENSGLNGKPLTYEEYLKTYHSDNQLNWYYYEGMYRRMYKKWLNETR